MLLPLIALTVAINGFKGDLYEPQRVKCYLYGDKCSFCSAAATHNNTPPGERFYSIPSLSLRGSMTLALFQEEAQPAFLLQQKLNGTNTLWKETIGHLLNVAVWSILLCLFPLFIYLYPIFLPAKIPKVIPDIWAFCQFPPVSCQGICRSSEYFSDSFRERLRSLSCYRYGYRLIGLIKQLEKKPLEQRSYHKLNGIRVE